jgi:hypothetical protein
VRCAASFLPQPSLGPASPHQLDHGCLTLLSSSSIEGFVPLGSTSLGVSAGVSPAPHAGARTGIPEELRQLCQSINASLPLREAAAALLPLASGLLVCTLLHLVCDACIALVAIAKPRCTNLFVLLLSPLACCILCFAHPKTLLDV